jgi:putative acetyltransferase
VEVTIRSETPSDIPAIAAVTDQAFRNAAHTSHTEQFIVSALRKAGQLAVSLVAELHGEIIGHVAVSPVCLSDGAVGWFGLGPISVIPRLQNRGVGSRLMTHALHVLKERGAAGCVLLGEPKFYQRFGFRAEPDLKLPDVPPEHFLAMPFGPTTRPSGTVSYHAGFYVEGPMHIAETDRLILRHVVPEDADFLCRLLNEPSWLQNIGDRGVRTPLAAEQYIQDKFTGSYESLGFGMYLAELNSDHSPIGLCGLVQRGYLPGPDIGFATLPAFWGSGYAFEASAAIMRYSRSGLGLARLLAIVKPDNLRSARLLERLGFLKEGECRVPSTDELLNLYGVAV